MPLTTSPSNVSKIDKASSEKAYKILNAGEKILLAKLDDAINSPAKRAAKRLLKQAKTNENEGKLDTRTANPNKFAKTLSKTLPYPTYLWVTETLKANKMKVSTNDLNPWLKELITRDSFDLAQEAIERWGNRRNPDPKVLGDSTLLVLADYVPKMIQAIADYNMFWDKQANAKADRRELQDAIKDYVALCNDEVSAHMQNSKTISDMLMVAKHNQENGFSIKQIFKQHSGALRRELNQIPSDRAYQKAFGKYDNPTRAKIAKLLPYIDLDLALPDYMKAVSIASGNQNQCIDPQTAQEMATSVAKKFFLAIALAKLEHGIESMDGAQTNKINYSARKKHFGAVFPPAEDMEVD